MKKVLYSTTALAAAGMFAFSGADAQAQGAEKIKLGLGGFYIFAVGFADNDDIGSNTDGQVGDDYGTVNMYGDSEVSFTGSTTLDNGIKVDVILQLETDQVNNGTQIDESYIKIGNTKSWGELRLGSTKQAAFTFKQEAPAVLDITNSRNNDQNRFLVNPTGTTFFAHNGPQDNMKAVYITPNFSGFQAGVSYTPSTTNSDAAIQTGGTGSELSVTSFGGTYKGNFGDVGVAVAAGYSINDGGTGATNSSNTITVGGNVTFANFTVGGHWAERDDDRDGLTAADIEGWNVGALYKTGPWKVALTWAHTEDDVSTTAGEDEIDTYTLGVAYSLGAGITAGASIFVGEYDDETTNTSANNEGWGALAGVKVAF